MAAPPEASPERVSLGTRGLRLGAREVPLISGSVHYWRLDPREWLAALTALQSLGIEIVDVYLPWGVHEQTDGSLDFGARDPRLDAVRFLNLAHSLGLLAIVRPGPHINAELTFFGIPERVIWNRDCQARSPRGMPVVLPVPPLAFPVPSYASVAFLDEADRWLEAVAERLAPLVWPAGPIVLCQVDNEGALYFRDGVYDQDHHPDAVATYRAFLLHKYGSIERIREVLHDPAADLAALQPPARFSATSPLDLARHLDAAEAQEEIIARAFLRMKETLQRAGLAGIPTMHNLPFGEGSTPLDPERVNRVVDLLGLDYYHVASETTRAEIARRTSDLAVRARARGYAPFACELGAGFPPFFPPISEADSAFTAMTALAYGLRGFNLYMAVERDRWIGAPIDRHGQRRPFADFWERLVSALQRLNFFDLQVSAAVHIVVPRNLRRLARVLHAFGPVTLAAFHVSGGGAEEACFEDDFGMGSPGRDRGLAIRETPGSRAGRGTHPLCRGGGRFDGTSACNTANGPSLPVPAGSNEKSETALSAACKRGERSASGPTPQTATPSFSRCPSRSEPRRVRRYPASWATAIRHCATRCARRKPRSGCLAFPARQKRSRSPCTTITAGKRGWRS